MCVCVVVRVRVEIKGLVGGMSLPCTIFQSVFYLLFLKDIKKFLSSTYKVSFCTHSAQLAAFCGYFLKILLVNFLGYLLVSTCISLLFYSPVFVYFLKYLWFPASLTLFVVSPALIQACLCFFCWFPKRTWSHVKGTHVHRRITLKSSSWLSTVPPFCWLCTSTVLALILSEQHFTLYAVWSWDR